MHCKTLARPELKTAIDLVNQMIASLGMSNGVASLNSNGKVPLSQLDSAGIGGVPSGTIFAFAASNVPSNYLLCDGSAVSRSTYQDLFNAIGTTYGAGDGSTTFNIPDLRGRIVIGRDDMGGTRANRITNTGTHRWSRHGANRRRSKPYPQCR